MFNNGILLEGVLIPKLLNKPFAFCSFKNLDFLTPQTEHFDCITNLLFFVLTILGSIFSAFFLHYSSSYFYKNLDLLDQQTTQ